MKIAEALAERQHVERRMDELQRRAVAAAAAGANAAEDANGLLDEFEEAANRLVELSALVPLTEASARVPDGRTLTELQVERAVLERRRDAVVAAADAASGTGTALDVRALRREAEVLARDQMELEVLLGRLAWQVDVIDTVP